MDARHKKYMDMTKAALVERVVQLLGQRDAAITDAEQADARLKEAMGRIDAHEKSYQTLLQNYTALQEKTRALDMQCRRAEAEFQEMNTDRDNWKQHFLEEQAANRKSKELLVRQAHLAGELAQMVTPANLRNI